MAINVAINGFGRIGRMVLRAGWGDRNINFVAINDLTDTKTLAHLLKYDSVHGKFNQEIGFTDDSISLGRKKMKVFSEKDPTQLPWRTLKVDVVIESTGRFRDPTEAGHHLTAGAKKVIVSATLKPKDGKNYHDATTIVKGVNSKSYSKRSQHIISNASCTTNNVAPILKVIHSKIGIKRCSFNTIHGYTSSQHIVDLPHKDLRRARAAAVNIIPTDTSADKAAVEAIPELKGKVRGFAFRVPIVNGSITEFTIETNKIVTKEGVNNIMKKASLGSMKGVIEYSETELVSSDIIGNSHSAIFDSKLTTVIDDKFIHIAAWYDNEWGYSCRIVDMIKLVG
jgi:glyceraldehyde 3-phosphate dehydrogenase